MSPFVDETAWNHLKTPKPQGFYLYIGVHLMRRSGRSSPLTTRVVSSRLFFTWPSCVEPRSSTRLLEEAEEEEDTFEKSSFSLIS